MKVEGNYIFNFLFYRAKKKINSEDFKVGSCAKAMGKMCGKKYREKSSKASEILYFKINDIIEAKTDMTWYLKVLDKIDHLIGILLEPEQALCLEYFKPRTVDLDQLEENDISQITQYYTKSKSLTDLDKKILNNVNKQKLKIPC